MINQARLQTALKQLHELVGLTSVKRQVDELVDNHQIEARRGAAGLKAVPLTLHLAFLGPPGTGKTTVARLVGDIYAALGFLKKGHTVEVDRSNLVGMYQGHSEDNAKTLFGKAKDGVLFIDEAYSLVPRDGSKDDFGAKALEILMKAMDDQRDRSAVVLAGYEDEMKVLWDFNPGFRRRIASFIQFEAPTDAEIIEGMRRDMDKHDYQASPQAWKAIERAIAPERKLEGKKFGNFGWGRQAFQRVRLAMSSRLARRAREGRTIEHADLVSILEADVLRGLFGQLAESLSEPVEAELSWTKRGDSVGSFSPNSAGRASVRPEVAAGEEKEAGALRSTGESGSKAPPSAPAGDRDFVLKPTPGQPEHAGNRQILEQPNWEGEWEREKLMPRSRSFRSGLARLASDGVLVEPSWEGDRTLSVRWPNGEVAPLCTLYGSGPWVRSLATSEYVGSGDSRVKTFEWRQAGGAVDFIRSILTGHDGG